MPGVQQSCFASVHAASSAAVRCRTRSISRTCELDGHWRAFGNARVVDSALRGWWKARAGNRKVAKCCDSSDGGEQKKEATETKREKLISFLKDASTLGTIRFVNISQGVVLETIGRFDYAITPFETPAGNYITVSSPDKLFECHINTDKIATITLSEEKSKLGDHKLYVIRLKDDSGGNLLSCLLMWDPSSGVGSYSDNAVKRFEALIARYGTQLVL